MRLSVRDRGMVDNLYPRSGWILTVKTARSIPVSPWFVEHMNIVANQEGMPQINSGNIINKESNMVQLSRLLRCIYFM